MYVSHIRIWLCYSTKPNHIYLIYMYKEDLPLNNYQVLICHKTKPNQMKFYLSTSESVGCMLGKVRFYSNARLSSLLLLLSSSSSSFQLPLSVTHKTTQIAVISDNVICAGFFESALIGPLHNRKYRGWVLPVI